MSSKILSKKELLLQDFFKLKNLLHHQLEKEYAEVFIKQVFQKAQKEFERMIPQLPLLDLETTNKHPYLRLFLFASMSMAIYFALNFYLKDKKLAKRIITTFVKLNMPIGIGLPTKVFVSWMFNRFRFVKTSNRLIQ